MIAETLVWTTIAVLLLGFSVLTVPWDKSFDLSTQESVERRWIWAPPTPQSDVSYRLAIGAVARQLLYAALAFGILLAFFSLSPFFYPAVVLIFSGNIFASIFQTLNNTAIQLLISDDVRGRISSFLMMSFSLPLLGTLPLSAVAERLGAPVAVGGASALAAVAALIFHVMSPALRDLDARVRAASVQD